MTYVQSSAVKSSTSPRPHRAGPQPSGFTLIELLVVISIIALMIAILLPALGAAREAAQASACSSNMRQMLIGTHGYAADNKDYVMPFTGSNPAGVSFGYWHYALLPQYLMQRGDNWGTSITEAQKTYLTCLADDDAWSSGLDPSYGYNAEMGRAHMSGGSLTGAGVPRPPRPVAQFLRPTETVLFADSFHDAEYTTRYGSRPGNGGVNSTVVHFKYPAGFSFNGIWKPYGSSEINGFRHSGDSANIGWMDGHGSRESTEQVAIINADPAVLSGSDVDDSRIRFWGVD